MEPTTLFSLPITARLLAETDIPEEIGWNIFWYVGLVIIVVLGFATIAKSGITKTTFKGPVAKLAEHLYLFLDGMAVSVIGPHGRKYVPLLLALWLYIFVSNVFGLIFNFTPTAEWSLNISLAVITMVYVQWEGIRANGLGGHLKHFAGPKLGGLMVIVSGLLFIVELVSETMKLFSLSIRLYGNIHGGHIVVSSLNQLVAIPIGGHVFNLPAGGLLIPIKFFTCVIQAYVFTILTCTYLNIVTSHEHEEEHYDVENAHPDANGHLVPEHPMVPDRGIAATA